MKIDEQDLVSATELARNTSQLLAKVNAGRRFVIINRNSPTAALIGMDDLRLLEQLTEQRNTPAIPETTPPAPPIDQAIAYLDALGIPHPSATNADSSAWNPHDSWVHSETPGLQIPLGLAEDGTPVTANFADITVGGDLGRHGLMQGAPGSGKSTALATTVLSLCALYPPERVAFVLMSGHRYNAFRGFEALPHVQRVIVGHDTDAIEELVTHLETSATERAELIRDSEWAAMDLATSSNSAPELFVVIDELEPMLRVDDRMAGSSGSLARCLIDLTDRGRALQIHLLLSSQRHGVRPVELKRNVSYRISLTTHDSHESREFIGTDGARFLPLGRGAAILNKLHSGATPAALTRFEFFNLMAAGPDGRPIRDALIDQISQATGSTDD
ncbi:type II toxin-antitoxin system prevent-host-death family antitoxin [Mycolicibacterium sp.]|uniref:type II toxin-antitoxin system prevent-host-death family antitoxin n=1 Tax=Mycolicibacterium sp. TaxID=2320850 RepID=UPI0037C9DEB5